MHELTERELYQALAYAKSIDEENGEIILDQFQVEGVEHQRYEKQITATQILFLGDETATKTQDTTFHYLRVMVLTYQLGFYRAYKLEISLFFPSPLIRFIYQLLH